MSFSLTATLELPPLPTSPGVARRLVACLVNATDAQVDTDAAVLLTSELVTNAVQHSDDPVGVLVDLNDDRMHVAVSDTGLGTPEMQLFDDPLAESGRGLAIVNVLAATWGVEHIVERGKTVWFEVLRFG